MTEKKLTYDELVERNRRLANKLIRRNEEFENTLRAELRKAKADAWDECVKDSVYIAPEQMPHLLFEKNPYKE